jgi:membrane associated rhomboid family serine protease
MALADREYFRYQPRPRNPIVQLFGEAPVTASLIAINVAVFLIDHLLAPDQVTTPEGYVLQFTRLEFWGHFSASFAIYGLQLWRLITFQFLHANLMHLAFNMLSLYIFGPLVEQHLGSARYLRYYLICGVGGAVAYLALFMKGVLVGYAWQPLVGASAGIFGILVAAAQVAPHATIMLLFPPIPMRLRTAAWVFIGIAVWTVFTRGRNAGGEAAHLGGAIVGFLLMQGEHLMGPRRLPPSPRGGYWDDA